MTNLEFSGTDYRELRKVCHHINELKAFVAELPEGKRDFLGRSILRPESGSALHSPLVDVLLCKKGHLYVVEYFLSEFEQHIDINRGATIRAPRIKDDETVRKFFHLQSGDVELVPPLVAACTTDNVEIVEYLILKGADPNKQAPNWGSPICIAAQYGCISVMKYLLDTIKVDINTTNYKGCTPLMMTCGLQMTYEEFRYTSKFRQNGGEFEMNLEENIFLKTMKENVSFLLQNGADVQLRNVDGYTVMHEAARKGRVDILMALRLEGVSPLFSVGDSSEKDYVPCPLYLAAANGHLNTVKYFCQLEDCPQICKGNAYLLLASQLNKRELWEEAFSIFEKKGIELLYPPAIPEYEYKKEISTLHDLNSVFDTDNYQKIDSHYQRLLIMERCLGLSHQSLVETILSKHLDFRMAGKCVEGIFKRAFQVCNDHQMHGQTFGSKIFDILLYITIGYGVLAGNCDDLRYIAEIGVLAIQRKSDTLCGSELMLGVHTVLMCLVTWYNYRMQASVSSSMPHESMPHEFYQLIQTVIPLILYLPETTAVNRLCSSSNSFGRNTSPLNFSKFVGLFLAFGGSEAINTPDAKDGMRPLHFAANKLNKGVDKSIDLVSVILSNGAHTDAVDARGKTALDYCSPDNPAYTFLISMCPAPLSCHAARKIVSDGFPYNVLDLPKHMISFIMLHDPKSIIISQQIKSHMHTPTYV